MVFGQCFRCLRPLFRDFRRLLVVVDVSFAVVFEAAICVFFPRLFLNVGRYSLGAREYCFDWHSAQLSSAVFFLLFLAQQYIQAAVSYANSISPYILEKNGFGCVFSRETPLLYRRNHTTHVHRKARVFVEIPTPSHIETQLTHARRK